MSFDRFFVSVLRGGHAGAPTFEEARQDYAAALGGAVPGSGQLRAAPSPKAHGARGEDERGGRAV